MKNNLIKSITLGILLTAGTALFAQPPGGGGGPGGIGPPPVGAPIDGGVIALLVSIVGYSYTQLKEGRKK